MSIKNSDESKTTEIRGTEIHWNEGKDPTKKTVSKTQKNKRTGETRTVSRVVDQDSFFDIFENRKEPEGLNDKTVE